MRLLEKWQCLNEECEKTFLVDKHSADNTQLCCPFCSDLVEAVAFQDSETNIEDQLVGCLYPSNL